MKKSANTPGKPLNQSRVLRAALRLADRQGIEQLTMRKLAGELKIEAMSLYNHVANKEAMLDGVLDLVIGKFEIPEIGGDWKSAMRVRAMSAHEVLLKHPWAASLMLSRIRVGPASLKWANATIGCLHEAGFSYAMADHASNAIDNHIYGFTLQIVNSPIASDDYADAARHYLQELPLERYPYIHAMANEVADGTHSGINDFEFGLDLILDGLKRLKAGQSG